MTRLNNCSSISPHGNVAKPRDSCIGGRRRGSKSLRRPIGRKRVEATEPGESSHRQEFTNLEERWQTYLQSDEFLTFHAVVESLLNLPPTSQLASQRSDFELLIHLLDRLGHALSVKHVSKSYRAQYSPDVQLSGYLYSTLLTAFTLLPSYTLNGQEFYVSDTVLDQCKSLQFIFEETCCELKRQFENLQPYTLEHVRSDARRCLIYFDRSWCRFEIPALEEIEAIHRQACRPLIEAIDVERALVQCESGGGQSAATRGTGNGGIPASTALKIRTEVQLSKLLEKLCELNRLANIEGKGRSDLDIACLLEAERISARPMCTHLHHRRRREQHGGAGLPPRGVIRESSSGGSRSMPALSVHGRCAAGGCASPVLVKVARALLRSLTRLRRVLQRYGRCLYQLNSHLANNPDLVHGLELFESAWERADKYLVQPGPRRLALVTFSTIISVTEPGFLSALDTLDPEFLIASLPRALLFCELRRVIAIASGHREGRRSVGPKRSKGLKKPNAASWQAAGAIEESVEEANAASNLPRPVLDGASCNAASISSFKLSQLARAFLPADVEPMYNEAVATMERLPEARLTAIRTLLVSPPEAIVASYRGGGSSSSRPASTVRPPRMPRASSAGPRTPCPPRMAVPNASRPATSKVAPVICGVQRQAGASLPPSPLHDIAEPEEEEDSDEEQDAAVARTMASIKSADGCQNKLRLLPTPHPAASQVTPRPPLNSAKPQEDPAERHVIASISTMALLLQREKPNDWNELIQVVLQGVMAMRCHEATSATSARPLRQIDAARDS
mmetsp:Transcript_88816/g.176565  ORF Transcript_88816/g.176565 Transcript_88816/m.176565 type:complete len:793 (-) Transcript_88816:255-2633(-)|eukprot:CAMPEP_0172739576 /NCGR_PEP_ID=MMETSP1074-20121228/122851_1 /TAXON_ID=2916 /ORGANISM="Ceratium fusus, Strain PA161109" /LENGTH=792 /DNA_ID=CAMNT_0013569483 /DNA_START=27 /DNA_END=2405 /DNA_ORIENTATION=-